MKTIIQFSNRLKQVKFIALTVVSWLGLYHVGSAQCPPGEIDVTIEITTDSWGSAAYWELVPSGNACGANTIFSGGNPAVGCNGGGAWNLPTGGYPNASTITEGTWCLIIGNTYDIIYVSDCGNDDVIFNVYMGPAMLYSVTFSATIINDTFTFTAQPPPPNNLRLSKIFFGTDTLTLNTPDSTLDHFYTAVPMCQIFSDTFSFWGEVRNDGINNASNVLLHVYVSGVETFSATSVPLTLLSSTASATLVVQTAFVPSTQGNYYLKFSLTSDSVDGYPLNDTVVSNFTVSDTVYARDLDDFLSIGWFGPGAYTMGNLFEINTTTTATSISMFIGALEDSAYSPSGKAISFELYDFGVNPPTLLAQEFHTVASSELLTWVTKPLVGGGVTLIPGYYLAAYQTYVDTFPFAIGNAPTSQLTAFMDIGNTGSWNFLDFTPFIRLNLQTCPVLRIKEDINKISFCLEPNPARGIFTLNIYDQKKESCRIELRNIFGHIIMEDHIAVNENHDHTYNLQNYSKGIYFITVKNTTSQRTEKVIIY